MLKTGKLLLITLFGLLTGCAPDGLIPDDNEPEASRIVKESYEVFTLRIDVENKASIVSKKKEDYLNCTVTVNGKGTFDDYTGTARIRGRGNSSWLWYDKKPYRIKLDGKSGVLGLKSNSDWVLLANYRDPTDLMNAFGFEVAAFLGLPFTNHSRFVEVTLNGSYVGLYQLTEEVEQGSNRVDLDPVAGWLICLDVDDGPAESPGTADNFWSTGYNMPVCVKYPEEPTAIQLSAVREEFGKLEKAIRDFEYDSVALMMDIPSFIDYLILQELVYNVEIDAPRSVYIHKDKSGKFVMGPAWDFDAGFDFDWGTMYTGHNFFNAQELVLGTDPVNHVKGYKIPGFFTQMFNNKRFVTEYKARWNSVKDSIFLHAWGKMEKHEQGLQAALARDYSRWPIDRNYKTEFSRMKDWLSKRVIYLNGVINNYPEGYVQTVKKDCGTVTCNLTLSYQLEYAQNVKVNLDEKNLLTMLGITTAQLNGTGLKIVPLKTDGSEGENNTNGTWGAWFEKDNNPGFWANGRVYIEIFNNLTSWDCGLRAGNGYCSVGNKYHVRMQVQYTRGTETKTVTVLVNFTIGS